MAHDGTRAAAVMQSFGTWRAGHCLEAVVAAYRKIGVPSLGRPAPTAYVGWQQSDLKHPDDRNPPPGVPVWWGPKRSSSAGDVVISLGGGRVVATDWPHNGVIGVTTIDARERQIGRPYLGWTEDILGVPVYNQPAPTGGGNTIRVPEEDDMIAAHITDGNGVEHYAIIGKGYLRHLIEADDPEWMKNVVTGDDRWTDIPIQRLPSVLRTFACDLHIWDIRNGSMVVLDPLTGDVAPGMLWSDINAARSAIEQVQVTSAETAKYIAELADA